jgi:predicted O-methyltransferase YrrM
VGVFPIRDHYYEPLFQSSALRRPLDEVRSLPGIDLNVPEQLRLLERLDYGHELTDLPRAKPDDLSFYLDNGSFESGDAEYLYNLIRLKKPRRIYEIGSGNSTLMARKATQANRAEVPGYECEHLCVEPFEMPWLERTGLTVIRRRVEDLPATFWSPLQADDLLFIDSSHVIRPQGDVLFEYLEVLPTLAPGVIVHVHDIFTPRDYPRSWVVDEVRLWNEQYLLEAFLTSNDRWRIIGALNYLHHAHFEKLRAKCPFLTRDREPGSFYIQRSS